jgi:hypothetical protein
MAKTLGELFDEQETILDRRARERREAEEAFNKTPVGIAEREALLERIREREAARANEPEDEPEDEDEDEDED